MVWELTKLDAKSLEILKAAIYSSSAFDPTDEAISALSSKLNWPERTLRQLFTVVDNIYKIIRPATDGNELSDAEIRIGVQDVLSHFNHIQEIEGAPDLVADRLVPLLQFNTNAELQRKEDTLRRGLLPFATDFSSVVELRPLFSVDRKTILKYIVAMQFKIVTDKKGAEDFVFHIEEEDLSKMREALDTLENKLESVRSVLTEDGKLQPNTRK